MHTLVSNATSFCILFFGYLGGLLIATLFSKFNWDFSESLKACEKLGIVSATTLTDYPKSRDLILYLALLWLPFSCAALPWWLWKRTQKNMPPFLSTTVLVDTPPTQNLLRLWGIFALMGLLCFNIGHFFKPDSDWPLLSEMGQQAAWAQFLWNGKVFAKDFFCPYGPLMAYLPFWVMQLFHSSLMMIRVVTFGMDMLALGIVFVLFQHVLKNNLSFLFSSLLFTILYSPYAHFYPSESALRTTLGILPLFFVFLFQKCNQLSFLALAGIALGICLLLSPEIGLCSLLVCVLYLIFLNVSASPRHFALKNLSFFSTSTLLSMTPMIAYLAMQGALPAALFQFLHYCRHTLLGYAALPLPSLEKFLQHPLEGESLLLYGIILLHSFVAVYFFVRAYSRRMTQQDWLLFFILIFSVLEFRSAIARADLIHVLRCSLPIFILLFYVLARGLDALKIRKNPGFRVANLLLSGGLILLLDLFFIRVDVLNHNLKVMVGECLRLKDKFVLKEEGQWFGDLPRAGVYFDDKTAGRVALIRDFLKNHLEPGGSVYFFPNEAVYYFLLNLPIPVSLPYSYQAVTKLQREQVVLELKKSNPQYVICNLHNWRPDNIDENIQLPEIFNHIERNYERILHDQDILILKRKTG